MLTSNWRGEVDTENFINQYYMNHWGEEHLVQQIYANRLNAVDGPIAAGAEQVLLSTANNKAVLDIISRMRYLVVSVLSGKRKKPVQTLYRVGRGTPDAPVVLHKAAKLGGMTRRGQVTRQYNPAVDYQFVKAVTPGNDSSWGVLNDVEIREANALPMSDSDIERLISQDPQARVTLKEAQANPVLFMFPRMKNADQREAQEAAGVVRSDSQVQKLAKLTGNNAPQIITEQLVAHLRKQGINVYDRAAMAEFLKTHDIRLLQQMITAYGKQRPYLNSQNRAAVPEILDVVKQKEYTVPGTDVVTIDRDDHRTIYLIDHSSDAELADNLKNGDGFGIRDTFNIDTITSDDCRKIIRNIASSNNFSARSIYNVLSKVGITDRHLRGIDIDAELKMVAAADDSVVLPDGGEGGGADNYGRGVDGRESQKGTGQTGRIGNDGIETFTTPQGEVYGFVDKDGNIYLDETKISPEHPIHEYTHLWDRAVQKRNPELWKRGVELMKQSGLWDAVLNSENYGKNWQEMGITGERLDNLIASEIHAQLTGKQGATLLKKLEMNGSSNIVERLKKWILDFWKTLKETFGGWTRDELDSLTLTDFNNMTIRDLANGTPLSEDGQVSARNDTDAVSEDNGMFDAIPETDESTTPIDFGTADFFGFGANVDSAAFAGAVVRTSETDDDVDSSYKDNGVMLNIVVRDDKDDFTVKSVPATPDNVRTARRQRTFVELNEKLEEILNKHGVGIGVLYNAEARMHFGGVADFDTADVTAAGLVELIRLAEGYEGEQALPEEFAHVALEMLGHDHPLVNRLLNAIDSSDEALQEAYDGMYNEYEAKYGKDNKAKLVLEAAGKLVAKHLLREQEIQTSVIRRLVSRVCDAIKDFFRKFSRDEVQNAIFDANRVASKIAREMLGGRLADDMSLENISSTGQFLNVKNDISGKKDVLSRLLTIETKRLALLNKRLGYLKKGVSNASVDATAAQVQKLKIWI